MCPARETGLPGTCAAGLRGAQRGCPPEQSGVHRLRSSPAGKKNAVLVRSGVMRRKSPGRF